jgi:hypothetical protein
MPVQINELIIRANVTEGGEKKGESSTAGSDNSPTGREDIVKECVAIVMEILKNKNQR